MRFGKNELKDYKSCISREYLITNGIGGYCTATICGSNIRKYSALLVACLNPPVDRRVLLSKLDETIYIEDNVYKLYTNEMEDRSIDEGFIYQQSFEYDMFPCLNYQVQGVFIKKEITMVYGKNTTVIKYTIINNNKTIKMRIDPLINNRDHHGNTVKGDFECNQEVNPNGTKIKYSINDIELNLMSDKAYYSRSGKWTENMFYYDEHERGLCELDAHFVPGFFEVYLAPYKKIEFSIIASTDNINLLNGNTYFNREKERKKLLLSKLKHRDELTEMLSLACDQFIVKRKSTGTSTVIAGYPWFTDWGRDTMIALPGLTLCTGRFEEGREMLLTFGKYVKDGLVPNMFPDDNVEPIYNTIDASLWYFNAVHKYIEYTSDYNYIKDNILVYLSDIMEHHIKGTVFNIGMDEDKLLKGGDKSLQLTWMDVKIKDWAVTPRQGKAVEINALWYNAVKIYSDLLKRFDMDYECYDKLAVEIKKSFLKKFWNKKAGYFYDYIDGDEFNTQIRPNAIIALSLPYTMVDDKVMAKKVLGVALEKLYTCYGLRSLAQDDKQYKGIYNGDLISRDSVYHQGTVWSWLIGPFVTAINRWYGDKQLCMEIIKPYYDHLRDRCVGNVSEVFDGDSPHIPRACFAQAWGAAELLRAYMEDVVK